MNKQLAYLVYEYLMQGKLDVVKYIIENQVKEMYFNTFFNQTVNGISVTKAVTVVDFEDGSRIIKETIKPSIGLDVLRKSWIIESKDFLSEIKDKEEYSTIDNPMDRVHWLLNL